MTLDEAVTLEDYIGLYEEKFGQEPSLWEGKGFEQDLIDDIVRAIKNNTPIEDEDIPEDAQL